MRALDRGFLEAETLRRLSVGGRREAEHRQRGLVIAFPELVGHETQNVSSGVVEIDDAIRRIVHSHVHYPAFPPGLAREYDVIEIRRTWHFDVAVRLY